MCEKRLKMATMVTNILTVTVRNRPIVTIIDI